MDTKRYSTNTMHRDPPLARLSRKRGRRTQDASSSIGPQPACGVCSCQCTRPIGTNCGQLKLSKNCLLLTPKIYKLSCLDKIAAEFNCPLCSPYHGALSPPVYQVILARSLDTTTKRRSPGSISPKSNGSSNSHLHRDISVVETRRAAVPRIFN